MKKAQGRGDLWQIQLKIQGDPNQSLLFQMAITLKICISDTILVRPKCVLDASIYFHFSAVCLQFSKTNAGFQKHILVLPTEMHIFRVIAI